MKTLMGILGLMLAGSCLGQTNDVITFTNRSGEVVSNAVVVRHDEANLIYRIEGGGGSVRLADLPGELQGRYGFDAVKAAARERTEKESLAQQRKRQAEGAKVVATTQAEKKVRAKVAATGVIVDARVIQRLGDKLLIDASGQGGKGGYSVTPEYKKFVAGKRGEDYWKLPRERGTILLIDYADGRNVVDDDMFSTVAYPCGMYEYTAVSGGKRTVRKYTTDLDRAISLQGR